MPFTPERAHLLCAVRGVRCVRVRTAVAMRDVLSETAQTGGETNPRTRVFLAAAVAGSVPPGALRSDWTAVVHAPIPRPVTVQCTRGADFLPDR